MGILGRQVEILRIVSEAKRINVRGIADKRRSPNRLKGDLDQLIRKRCLHMEREGKEHVYTITKQGTKTLAKYDLNMTTASLQNLHTAPPDVLKGMKKEIADLNARIDELSELSREEKEMRAYEREREDLQREVDEGRLEPGLVQGPSGGFHVIGKERLPLGEVEKRKPSYTIEQIEDLLRHLRRSRRSEPTERESSSVSR